MAFWSIIFRIALAMLLVHCIFPVSSINSESKINVRSKFPVNDKERRMKREEEIKLSPAKFGNKLEEDKRKRRESFCSYNFPCDSSISYRTIDGTCNNVNNSWWGSSNMPFVRFLPPRYENGFSTPRGFGALFPLPRSRDVSATVANTITTPSPDFFTLMVMVWGQFLAHDMQLTTNDASSGSPYFNTQCCDDFMDPTPGSPSCMPLDVTGDSFYSNFDAICLPFVRSSQSFCSWPLEQMNENTAYLDASLIYGANILTAAEVREPNSWKLKSGPGDESCSNPNCLLKFLPVRNNTNTGIEEFFAGDIRVEEQPGLTSLHTIFVRFHNDIGQIIRNLHANYSDEEVYQEVRKIIGALIQQITYSEFLPIVLGNNLMTTYKLKLQSINANDPHFHDYNPVIDATIANVFATAAYRFGHSLIKGILNLPGGITVNLASSFLDHTRTTISGTFPSQFIRGICSDFSEDMDQILVDAVLNKLFAKPNFTHGQDLFARNTERGRDHGTAPYIEWLNVCRGLPNAISQFHDLSKVMPSEIVDAFYNLYGQRLDAIDLYPAGISEYSLPGALLGPTFACIIAEQFFRLKVGDRFWFENPNSFPNTKQLKSIRKTKLSSILCKYTDAIQLQENVMLPVSPSNPLKDCSVLIQNGVLNDDLPLIW